MSNALLKSNIAKSDCCLESKFCIISCIVKISWLSHEWPLRNPCCNGDMILLFSRWLSMCLQTMCSTVLQYTLVRDIGLGYRAYIYISPVIWKGASIKTSLKNASQCWRNFF